MKLRNLFVMLALMLSVTAGADDGGPRDLSFERIRAVLFELRKNVGFDDEVRMILQVSNDRYIVQVVTSTGCQTQVYGLSSKLESGEFTVYSAKQVDVIPA